MLFIEALETAKCFEEGVITSAAAANIGSIMGIGFPAITGGAAQFMTGWQALDETGTRVGPIGLDAFVARADELADGLRRAVPPDGVPPRAWRRRASPSPPDRSRSGAVRRRGRCDTGTCPRATTRPVTVPRPCRSARIGR